MSKDSDHYKSIASKATGPIIRDRGSKFIGCAFPVTSEEAVAEKLDELQEEYPQAHNWCYAWRLGKNYEHYRVNDGGEPSNSAGMPIYGQIQSFELTNVLVVVMRYFGGTKLGVGGLITAFKTTAAETLKEAQIVRKTIQNQVRLTYEYDDTSKIRSLINRENLDVLDEEFGIKCTITLGIPISKVNAFTDRFKNWKSVKATLID